jgi:hypothetical protein
MANFPGGDNALPGTYVETATLSRGASVPGGVRTAVLMGEGQRVETIVSSAAGGGKDGLNPSFTSTNGQDGRHFRVSNVPLVKNRTTLLKNGIPLVGTEGTNNGSSFPERYDYRVQLSNGTIELQTAHLVDQGGGDLWVPGNNFGDGYISNLVLSDEDAPTETWTVRVVSVKRGVGGVIIPGFAKLVAQGSVSGNILDGYGNQISWNSDGYSNTNGILEFEVHEGTIPLQEGDRFTIKVKSGVLSTNDNLEARYICELDLNQPQFFTNLDLLVAKHGSPSLTNRLSLGAQLAFANSPPGVWTVQTKPALPRRLSYLVEDNASGNDTASDLTFALPMDVTPDADGSIHFFVTDPLTNVETEIRPNKVAFYDTDITLDPANEFISNVLYTYSYTVIKDGYDDLCKVLLTEDLALGAGQSLRVTLVDEKDADFYDAGWVEAYESIEKIDTDIVVPLPSQTISTIFGNGKTHVQVMSQLKYKRERILFIGAIRGLEPENVSGDPSVPVAVEDIGIFEGIQGDDPSEILTGDDEDLANYGVQSAYSNTFRVVYFYPDEIVVQVGSDRAIVDGFFIAAAAAGYLSAVNNIAIPLTNKTLSGFTILSDKLYRPIILEQLTADGITVLQPVQGGGRVIRGQTTTNSGFIEERELSIVFIRDRIARTMRGSFDGFIGSPESDVTQAVLGSRANNVLASLISRGLITKFRDLKVQRDSVDPTQWNISVAVQPVYAVNFIYIKVNVGLL